MKIIFKNPTAKDTLPIVPALGMLGLYQFNNN